jgi:glycyl-tRNA synthetase
MFDAYNYDKSRENVVLKLHPKLSPIKIGVFPLVSNKADVVKKARGVYDELKQLWPCAFDLSGSIGRRYARADETGIYASVTIDFESLEDDSVTVRSRDTTEQIRVKISELKDALSKFMEGEKLGKLGKAVE